METARVFPNVHLGEGVVLQDWVVIGLTPRGVAPGALETVIEAGAVIRSHTVIYAGSRIGANFQTGHRVILGPGLEIGTNCSIGTDSYLMGYARLLDEARVHGHCTIGAFSLIHSGAKVGPRCLLESEAQKPTIIGSEARLGANIYVSSGVRVGEKSLVAAGAVLNQDVPPYRVMVGNPPRPVMNIAQITCPYELIDRPYEPDPPELQDVVKARHKQRPTDEVPSNSWRHQLWESLGSPKQFF